MLMQPHSQQEPFLARLRSLYEDIALSDALLRIRAKAWERFEHVGLPSRQTEVYQYIRLRHLFGVDYARPEPKGLSRSVVAAHLLPECEHASLVFVNGAYESSLSDVSDLDPNIIIM